VNVLVSCLYKHTFPQTWESIRALDWGHNLDTLFIYGPENTHLDQRPRAGRTRIQELFLAGRWDAMLSVDSDMVIPPNALRELHGAMVTMKADIAYGLYCWRYAAHRWNMSPLAGDLTDSVSDDPELARLCWGRITPTAGKGLGCTLIRRRVMEKIRIEARDGHAADHWLALQATERGYRQLHHLGVVCGHILHDNKGHARGVVWPDIHADGLAQITEA
jgi:hypothetical protein